MNYEQNGPVWPLVLEEERTESFHECLDAVAAARSAAQLWVPPPEVARVLEEWVSPPDLQAALLKIDKIDTHAHRMGSAYGLECWGTPRVDGLSPKDVPSAVRAIYFGVAALSTPPYEALRIGEYARYAQRGWCFAWSDWLKVTHGVAHGETYESTLASAFRRASTRRRCLDQIVCAEGLAALRTEEAWYDPWAAAEALTFRMPEHRALAQEWRDERLQAVHYCAMDGLFDGPRGEAKEDDAPYYTPPGGALSGDGLPVRAPYWEQQPVSVRR